MQEKPLMISRIRFAFYLLLVGIVAFASGYSLCLAHSWLLTEEVFHGKAVIVKERMGPLIQIEYGTAVAGNLDDFIVRDDTPVKKEKVEEKR